MNAKDKIYPISLCISLVNFLGLILVWWMENFWPEAYWPVAALTFAPQILFAFPTLLLAFYFLIRRRWRMLAVQAPAGYVMLFGLLNFNINSPIALGGSPAGATQVRVLSYNIRYGSLGIDPVVETIRSANADIICVQEAYPLNDVPDPAPILERALSEYQMMRWGEILIFSRFPVENFYQHKSLNPLGNGVLEARLLVNGKRVTVFCAHFINPISRKVLDDPQMFAPRSAIRRQQFNLLDRVTSETKTPYFIAGDFNTPPRGELYRSLSARHRDGFKESGIGFGKTFPAKFPIERIDYVWTGNGARTLSCRVLSSQASDHRPLMAQVEFP